ncbi:MAG: hypothetical protein HRU41_30150 [Saprospiraceae bacterium]|nr:hypothetical protein [Saprospiraceae bacterium]
MDQKLTYAVRDGRLVHIGEVVSGLKCNCVCPSCGSLLIARKGNRNSHHFAHHNKKECPHALESMLHYLAKHILLTESFLQLPPIFLPRQQKPLYPERRFFFEKVRLEKRQEGFVPDLILEKGSQSLLVEIRVTHEVERTKLWRIRRSKAFAIEIDAGSLFHHVSAIGPADDLAFRFRKLLKEDLPSKNWLHHPSFQANTYRLKLQSDKKKIIRRTFKNYELFAVSNCPRKLRYWRKGYREGKSYAKVWQDCQQCPYCLEIEFSKRYIAYREIPEDPRAVYCWGHLVDDPVP